MKSTFDVADGFFTFTFSLSRRATLMIETYLDRWSVVAVVLLTGRKVTERVQMENEFFRRNKNLLIYLLYIY